LETRPHNLYEPLPASKFPRRNGFIHGVRLKKLPVGGFVPVEDLEEEELEQEVEEVEEQEAQEDQVQKKQTSIAEFFAKKPSGIYSVSTQTNMISISLLEAKQNASKANQIVADMYNAIRRDEEEEEAFRPWYKLRIWQSKFGSAKEGICPVCSTRQITSDSFSAGHILARSRGGTFAKDNIMPICHDCNHEMGTNHLFWFAWKYYGKVLWPFNH
jgi:hypothetical protein